MGFDDVVLKINAFLSYISEDLPGKRIIQMRHPINLMKGAMGLICLFLCYRYNNFGVTAMSYLILHGTYGLLWLLKDIVNGDKNWTKSISLSSALIIMGFLVGYAMIAVATISNKEECHPLVIILAFYLNIIGVFFTFASDFQKNSILKIRSGLITDGLYQYSRNPNYFGEILIYFSFVLLSRSVFVYFYILFIWVFYFYPRMLMKDRSISRHKGWKEYKESTYLLFPKIF